MNELGKVLHAARLAKGLSHRDIDKLSDGTITHTYAWQVETRGDTPSPKKLRVLCKVLKIDYLKCLVLAGHVTNLELKDGGR